MLIAHPTDADWQAFLDLARREGWRVPAPEVALLRGPLAPCAFVLREAGQPRGFVTAVGHGRSGWVGNLLVPRGCRGRGYGSRLFDHALAALERQGTASVWLTASALGRPIYEKRGFATVDGIVRFVLRPPGGEEAGKSDGEEALLAADALVWGEARRALLSPLVRGGRVFACGGTAALLQGGEGLRVLGPWASAGLCPRENRQVLAAAVGSAPAGVEVAADVLASSPVRALLLAAGFAAQGRTDLMVRGGTGGADLGRMVALASLGSLG